MLNKLVRLESLNIWTYILCPEYKISYFLYTETTKNMFFDSDDIKKINNVFHICPLAIKSLNLCDLVDYIIHYGT